jgi:hypothetical protein
MEKYLRLFAALERIFGKGYVSRLMGKQSNVITLPDKQARKFLDTELNVMEASEGAVKKGVQDLNNLVSDTKRLSTLNDQELLTITNNAERLAVKVNPPAPPPAPTADVLSITTKVNKNKDPNVLIDEYNKNQTRLRLTDDEGGTAISYDEFRKLQSRNNEIEKTLESLNVKPALDEVKPEGIVIPFTKKTEDFATGGRVGMAGGGILKLAMKFFNDNNPVSAYKKYLKYVKETAQKDPAKLAPEVGGIVVGSELIHRGLRRKLKEVKEKNNENDSENLETDNRTEKAGGGVSQGLDYLTGIERRGYAGGSILKTIGKKLIKKPKTETTSIDPIIDENVDLSKRGFLKGAAGVGAGIAAFGSGALKLAKKGAKEVKDLDVVFRKNYDGEYIDGTPTVFSEIIADIVPYTKKAKTFLEDMVKQKKVIKNNDGSYFVDVQDIHDMGGDIGVFKDIGNKFNYKTFKTDNYVDIEEIKDLRSYSSPLKNNPTYGPIDFEDDAAEYVVDALQPKTAKEIIKERTDLIERKLKERGDFAGGGPIKKIAQKLIKKPKKYKFTGEESLNDLFELERQGKITREDMNVYSPRYLEYLDAQIITKKNYILLKNGKRLQKY